MIYDKNKIGTLIIGSYRSGTHFLMDNIVDISEMFCETYDEICGNNTTSDLEEITRLPSDRYKLAILNNMIPKFYLTNATELLGKWHVVHLTRKDKVSHFISHWIWHLQKEQEKKGQTYNFQHHGTKYATYRQHLPPPVNMHVIGSLMNWLQEQMINEFIPCDFTLDYEDLKFLPTNQIPWRPNDYGDIGLSDFFTNHEEFKNFLENFKIHDRNRFKC